MTKYSVEPGVFQMEPATMVNMDKWKKIPKDVQALMMEIMQDMEYIATMRNVMLEQKEVRIRTAAGMKVIELPPADAEKFVKIASDTTWAYLIEKSPEYGPKLERAHIKEGLATEYLPVAMIEDGWRVNLGLKALNGMIHDACCMIRRTLLWYCSRSVLFQRTLCDVMVH